MPFNVNCPPPLHPDAPVKIQEPLKFPSFPLALFTVNTLLPKPGTGVEDTVIVSVPTSSPFISAVRVKVAAWVVELAKHELRLRLKLLNVTLPPLP
jgi:hypothetical protein